MLTLQRSDLKTDRAWAIKENFRHFWDYVYAYSAEGFFERWYGWAIRSRLEKRPSVPPVMSANGSSRLGCNDRLTLTEYDAR